MELDGNLRRDFSGAKAEENAQKVKDKERRAAEKARADLQDVAQGQPRKQSGRCRNYSIVC